MSDCRIYVGNLPPDCRNNELEDIFYKYGRIRYVDIKKARGPPFAFVEFDDPLDAEDAVRGRDGYNFDGYRLKVEFQKGSRAGGSRGGYGARGGPPTRRSDYRVIVSGLPPTGSWQDIKDHMRVAGNVCYADVFKDGTGVCEFIRYDDMKYAVKHLDDTKFRSHEGETSYISVKSDYTKRRSSSRSYSRSRSRSRTRSRSRNSRSVSASRKVPARRGEGERDSPSYSPAKRSRTRSRSYDKHERRSHRRTHSRSRSRSKSPVKRAKYERSASRSVSRSPKPKRSVTRSKSRSRSRSRGSVENVNGNGVENGRSDVYHDASVVKE